MSRKVLLNILKLTVQSGAGRLRDFSLRADRGLLLLMHSEDRWKVTSLFKVLAGQEAPLEGDINYRGSGIGLVLSDDKFPEWSKIRNELELYAKLSGIAMETMEALMETWNLEGIYALPGSALSHYERKAFFLVLESAGKPDLLICQEPLEGLNPRQQRRVLNNLKQYADQGRIVILGTVDPGQYPGVIPMVSLDRTGQEYDETDLPFTKESSFRLKQEMEPELRTQTHTEQKLDSSPHSGEAIKEARFIKDPLFSGADSMEVSRSYRDASLQGSDVLRRRTSLSETDSPTVLSSSGSFGGRRLFSVHLNLPVSEETEFKLRRISEIKYFQPTEDGYEVDILEEDRLLLPKRLEDKGLKAGVDKKAQRRDEQ